MFEPPEPDDPPELLEPDDPPEPDDLSEPPEPDDLSEPLFVGPVPLEEDPDAVEDAGVAAGVAPSPDDGSFLDSPLSLEEGVDVADWALRLSVI